MSKVTAFIVHSPVSMILVYVSLILPVAAEIAGPMAIIGGFEANALKKLYGARLRIPSFEIVETSAIGLGATPLNNI